MSLSPFYIKGKGQIKNQHKFFCSCRKKSVVDLMCTEDTMLPFEFMRNVQTYFSMKYMTLWLSYHQWLILTSKIQPSGFTYETQVPNQVGLHISTQLPNQVGLQIWQVLTWLKITILHHGSQHDLFIKIKKWLFITNTRKSSRKRTYFRTIIMPTMHYTQQR